MKTVPATYQMIETSPCYRLQNVIEFEIFSEKNYETNIESFNIIVGLRPLISSFSAIMTWHLWRLSLMKLYLNQPQIKKRPATQRKRRNRHQRSKIYQAQRRSLSIRLRSNSQSSSSHLSTFHSSLNMMASPSTCHCTKCRALCQWRSSKPSQGSTTIIANSSVSTNW